MLLKGKYPCRVVIHQNAVHAPSSPAKATPVSPQKTGKTVDIRTMFGNKAAAPAPASIVDVDDDDSAPKPQKRFLVDDGLSTPGSKAPSSNSNTIKPSTDTRQACTYGAKCYRKNPAHFREFWHPPKDGEPAAAVTVSVDAKPPPVPKAQPPVHSKKREYEKMVEEPPTPPKDVIVASPSEEFDLPPSASLGWDDAPAAAAVDTSASVNTTMRKQIAAATQKPVIVQEPDAPKVVRQPTIPYVGPTMPNSGPKPIPSTALHTSGSAVSSVSALPSESHVLVLPVLSTGPEFCFPPAPAVNIAMASILSFCQQHPDANFRICVVELRDDSEVFRELRRCVAEHQARADWCGSRELFCVFNPVHLFVCWHCGLSQG
jgi:PBZ domain